MTSNNKSFETFPFVGMAIDPIHVGTGGVRLGRVDNTIVRDPVTKIPKIPGSSIAGVMRAYTAMAEKKYPQCAGLGQPEHDETGGHCGEPNCPVCTVFGFAKSSGAEGGFAGLAAFSDMHVLLFPIASQEGPKWLTCPMTLRHCNIINDSEPINLFDQDVLYLVSNERKLECLNLGWLYLKVKDNFDNFNKIIQKIEKLNIPEYFIKNMVLVSDKLFKYLVNSSLETRTSVAIDPTTGAAEEGALFTYEALPRSTALYWEVTCRNPKHFKIDNKNVKAVNSTEDIKDVLAKAHPYLMHLGIGGMGTRGMGRLKVVNNTGDKNKPCNGEKK